MLIPCGGCRRHVRSDEPACPFCGRAIEPAPARPSLVGRLSRAAVFAGLAGCGAPPTPVTQVDRTKQVDQTKQVEDRYDVKPAAGMGTLRGSVRDAQGIPVAHFSLELGDQVVRTDAQGFFTFADLSPGTHVLTYQASNNPRHNVESRTAEVKADEVIRVDIQLPPPDELWMEAKPYGAPPVRRRIV